MQQCLILGNRKRVKGRRTRKKGSDLGTHGTGGGRVLLREVRQEMVGGVFSRRVRRGRNRGNLLNNA